MKESEPGRGLATTAGDRGLSAAASVNELAGAVIRTPLELADRIRAMSRQAHVLSPAIAVSSIAEQYVINTAVVVIDTTLPPVEYGSAAGSDVYFQASIHKHDNKKIGDAWQTDVVEVSLNKNGLLKILGAAGVDITRSERTDDRRDPYYWAWVVEGVIVDFDGRRRRLQPGNVEIDYRDGAASIGEWSPAAWAPRVADAEARKASTRNEFERKKIKPEAINGWSEDRVRNARRFGLRIAEAEAMNRLARNLGLKQKYTLDELQKPFVLFRCSFNPDMSDPEVRRIVTAAHMGSTQLLYPGPPASSGRVIDLHSSTPHALEADILEHPAQVDQAQASTTRPTPAAAPAAAVPFDDLPAATTTDADALPAFLLTSASSLTLDGQDQFFFVSREGPVFVTEDRTAAQNMNEARKAGRLLRIESERVTLQGAEYWHVLGLSAPLPPIGKL